MDLTRTAYGTWNGGRFMNYGEPLPDERWISVAQHAYRQGIRTFLTADVYGTGAADELIGRALAGLPRDSYCLVGAVGHDFYKGQRQGPKGFPRFTDPALRSPREYKDYLRAIRQTIGGIELNRPYTSERDDWIQCMVLAGLGFTYIPEYAVTVRGLKYRRDQPKSVSLRVLDPVEKGVPSA